MLLIVFPHYNRISFPPGVYLTMTYDDANFISLEKYNVVSISSGRNREADRWKILSSGTLQWLKSR